MKKGESNMKKLSNMVVGSGACLLAVGVCMCTTLAGEPEEMKMDALADLIRFSSPRSESLAAALNAEDMTLGRNIQLAQAGDAGNASRIVFQAAGAGSGASASVGVSQEFSTWSDLTAMFRPSRWHNPFREGGSLSWFNYKAWANVPGRTAKILLGEAIVIGGAYAIIDSSSSSHSGDGDAVVPASSIKPVVVPTLLTSSSSNDDGDSGSTAAPPASVVVPPASTSSDAGGEMPF